MKIAVYAFANTAYFFEALTRESRGMADIEWQVILPRGHYRHLFEGLIAPENLFYLYQNFKREYQRARPPFEFAFPNQADNIYMSLSKDKDGYRHLDKNEQLRRAATIYSLYRAYLQRARPDYVIFPDLETVDGFILINLCYELGIEPVYYVGTRNLGRSFFTDSPYEELPQYYGDYTSADLDAADEVLALFAQGHLSASRLDIPSSDEDVRIIQPAPLMTRAMSSLRLWFRFEHLHAGEDNIFQRIKANIKPILSLYRRVRFRVLQTRHFDICTTAHRLPEKFVLFALQYTPESSINGLEPYFVDQTRAIDLIRQSLPSGFVLLVKEHPAMVGVRAENFYQLLRRMPGVELVHPSVPTRVLVDKAKLVATITGTIGLECFLAGRPCVLFGRTFFRHLCYSADSYRNFGKDLKRMLSEFKPSTMDERRVALAKLFNVSNKCWLGDPLVQPLIMNRANIRAFLAAVLRHISRVSEFRRNRVYSERISCQ